MALRLTFYRLPESLLAVQTSLDFTDLITHDSLQYGTDMVKLIMCKTLQNNIQPASPEGGNLDSAWKCGNHHDKLGR